MILLQDISFSISLYFVLLTPGKKNSIVVKITGKAIGMSTPNRSESCEENTHNATVATKRIKVTFSSGIAWADF